MNNSLKKVLAVIAIVAIAALSGHYTGGTRVIENKNPGALTGPDISSPYLSVGGVREEYRHQTLATATTTPCAIQSPAATSTLNYAALRIDTATSTATTWTLAKATSAYATTTKLAGFSLGSGAFGTMNASTTPSTSTTIIDDTNVIAPNTYLVWGVAGTIISDATKLNGVCQAKFTVI